MGEGIGHSQPNCAPRDWGDDRTSHPLQVANLSFARKYLFAANSGSFPAARQNEACDENLLLRDGDALRWDYLPWSFYARTHGWPPPRETHLYHANYTKGRDAVGQKIAQFEEFARLRAGGLPARAWSCLRRLPGAVAKGLG